MIKNCDEKFIKNTLFFFFNFIFHYGVIPNEFNVTHIIPIKKDKKITINDLNSLRPISISNILAQIFERLLSNKMKERLIKFMKIDSVTRIKPPVHTLYSYSKRR
jgi:hypothetical protein